MNPENQKANGFLIGAGFRFLGEVKSELDKVTWPDLNNVVRLTSIVIIITLLVGVYLEAAYFLFTNLLGILVR